MGVPQVKHVTAFDEINTPLLTHWTDKKSCPILRLLFGINNKRRYTFSVKMLRFCDLILKAFLVAFFTKGSFTIGKSKERQNLMH